MNVTDDIRKACARIGNDVFAEYKLYFSDIGLTIDNETIHQESVTLKQSICDAEELEFGGCIASEFSFEVSEIITTELKNKKFTSTLVLYGENISNIEIPIGVFTVDNVEMVNDKDYKKVTAYDDLKHASETDVSEWYNSIFATETTPVYFKDFKKQLLTYLRISYVDKTLPNDNMVIKKTIKPSTGSITGQYLLRMIAELQGGFGIINRDGKFDIINLAETNTENLYFGSDTYTEYRELKFEEYECKPITCLKISTDDEDVGQTIGSDLTNPYLISGNIFTYGKTAEELTSIGNNILPYIKIGYRPVTSKSKGVPYIDIGTKIIYSKSSGNIESYILSRELNGIHGMTDDFTAKGIEYRKNEVTQNTIVEQLKAKTLKIQKSVDGLSVELTDLENGTESKFSQTQELIEAEVSRSKSEEEKLSSRITQTTESIESEVIRATGKENYLSSLITQNANEIVLKVDSSGNIAVVALGVDADNGTNYFKVGADNIELTADEAINLLAGGTLNLTGKNITITSDNFTVDADGTIKAKNGSFEGIINALNGGKIGGWNVKNNWLEGDDNVGISWNRNNAHITMNGENLEMTNNGNVKIMLNTYTDNINDFSNNCMYIDVGAIFLKSGGGDTLVSAKDIHLYPTGNAYVNNEEILTTGSIKEKKHVNLTYDDDKKITEMLITYSDNTTETIKVNWNSDNQLTKIGDTEITWQPEGVG